MVLSSVSIALVADSWIKNRFKLVNIATNNHLATLSWIDLELFIIYYCARFKKLVGRSVALGMDFGVLLEMPELIVVFQNQC